MSDGRRAGFGGVGQTLGGAAPVACRWTCRGYGEVDAANRAAHQRADLQELEADGATGGVCKDGAGESDAPQRADEHVGHRGKPQTQLVGPHGRCRGAVSVEVELAFFDAVFHVAAGAVNVLVESSRAGLTALERGDDEARVGFALRPLRLGDDATAAAPAVERAPVGVLEPVRGSCALLGCRLGGCQLGLDLGDQTGVAGEPEQVIDAVCRA